MHSKQGFFDFGLPPRRHKTEDEIAVERIIAADMREQPPEPDPPGRERARDEIVRKINQQKRLNLRDAGMLPAPKVGTAATRRIVSYVERKSRR